MSKVRGSTSIAKTTARVRGSKARAKPRATKAKARTARRVIPEAIKKAAAKDVADGYTYQSVADYHGLAVGHVYRAVRKYHPETINRAA